MFNEKNIFVFWKRFAYKQNIQMNFKLKNKAKQRQHKLAQEQNNAYTGKADKTHGEEEESVFKQEPIVCNHAASGMRE